MAGRKETYESNVVVAVDKDKGSHHAMKWAAEHLMYKGQILTLLHVKIKATSIPTPFGNHVSLSEVKDDVAKTYTKQLDSQSEDVFLPFRCFCSRKDIKCNEVIVEDTDVSKAIIEFVASTPFENLVLGTSSRSGFIRRFRTPEVTTNVTKLAPDYCTVYIVGKGKLSSVRSATASLPSKSLPSHSDQLQIGFPTKVPEPTELASGPVINPKLNRASFDQRPQHLPRFPQEELEIRSPFTRPGRTYEPSVADSDISYVGGGKPGPASWCNNYFYDGIDGTPRLSSASSDYDNRSFGSSHSGNRSMDSGFSRFCSSSSMGSSRTSLSSLNTVPQDLDLENEMRRLKLELKQTMDMYSAACKEAFSAKQRANELQSWKLQEQQKLEEVRLAEEAALLAVDKEKTKYKAAVEAAQAAQRIADLEAGKRMIAESYASEDDYGNDERKLSVNSLGYDLRYRRYTIEEIENATERFSSSRKIGEGGYGPVYVGNLDHTAVAIKVLRPDAAQGESQFHKEVEVLSCIRHPNMVLLLGACPEYGCLVYEYMANGNLEDRLFRRHNTPVLPWQVRFQIAAEIATGLLFLHQTKPDPIVHRDLKPANILLDRNYVSKISDVGLARLVPPSIANSVTQYHMTQTAGTFCYIDPEYQQTGMLGTKSDVYSLGILLLQLITAKQPMGLTHLVENSIEEGNFEKILDPAVDDWPMEETFNFAKLALQCAELRRKDRPDLGKVVLPMLNKYRDLADENMLGDCGSAGPSPRHGGDD